MSRQFLPAATFECGIVLHREIPFMHTTKHQVTWHLIGKLEDGTPFFLQYTEPGVALWDCPKVLGQSLRRKILSKLRAEVRYADNVAFALEAHDLRELDQKDLHLGHEQAEKLSLDFFHGVWRARYLGKSLEDWVSLQVPFSEKDQAKALGARWDSVAKVWKVARQDDMSAFSRWLPAAPEVA